MSGNQNKSESEISAEIRIEFNRGPWRLLRNNIGMATFPNGQKVAYGVGGTGGADNLGAISVIITPEMVGKKIAVACAVEVKRAKKTATIEQQRFINKLLDMGGVAGVARSIDDVKNLFDSWKNKMQA